MNKNTDNKFILSYFLMKFVKTNIYKIVFIIENIRKILIFIYFKIYGKLLLSFFLI